MIKNIVGASVTADDFYGREKEIKSGLAKLESGNSLMLSAPRRVGKTSFAKKMIELLEKKGWIGIFINMESLKTEEGLYESFAQKLFERGSSLPRFAFGAKREIKRLSVSFKGLSVSASADDARQSLRKDILKIINNKKRPLKLLFVFDELAVFLHNLTEEGKNPDKAKDFLNWLRSVRQESYGQAQWIFCSSISIENFLTSNNLSASMNDVMEFPLGEMPENEALGLLDGLADGAKISIPDPTKRHILNKLGLALPYSIQGIFSTIIDNLDGRLEVTIKDVDFAYDQLLKKSPHLNTWYERLNEYNQDSTDLKHLLRYICAQPKPVPVNSLLSVISSSSEEAGRDNLNRLLRLLTHDGYIMQDNSGCYSFRMHLLKDYWKYHNL